MAQRPDALAERLTANIYHAQKALELAHETGYGHFAVQEYDTGVATTYHEGLAGCSDASFHSIIGQLKSVFETLKTHEGILNRWASKANLTESNRGFMST